MFFPETLTASDITYSMHGRFMFEIDNIVHNITQYEHLETHGDFAAFTINKVPGYMMRTPRDFISVLVENGTAHFRSHRSFWSRSPGNELIVQDPEMTPLECLNLFKAKLSATSLQPMESDTLLSNNAVIRNKALGALDDQIAKCAHDGYLLPIF